MELSYWQSRWDKGNTGFHMEKGYPGLRDHWPKLVLPSDPIVLVPLCGKSPDMAWIAPRAELVIGAEISEKAIRDFFSGNQLSPTVKKFAGFKIYLAENIRLWCGDFFKLPEHKLPAPDLVYDKAALVALPESMRERYVKKLLSLCAPKTKLLLHHFIYPQNEMNGPPFSVSDKEISLFFGKNFEITVLEENLLAPDLFIKFKKRGLKSPLSERLLLLEPSESDNISA